jgi:hypothetical protein
MLKKKIYFKIKQYTFCHGLARAAHVPRSQPPAQPPALKVRAPPHIYRPSVA